MVLHCFSDLFSVKKLKFFVRNEIIVNNNKDLFVYFDVTEIFWLLREKMASVIAFYSRVLGFEPRQELRVFGRFHCRHRYKCLV